MTRAPFEPLPEEAFIVRLAETGGAFLPPGEPLPTSDVFVPSTMDEAEAAARGRSPGVSVWDRDLTTLEQARRLRYFPEGVPHGVRGFGTTASAIREVSANSDYRFDVVADPLEPAPLPEELREAAGGHAMIEGLKRVPGAPRKPFRRLLDQLVEACVEVYT